MHILAAAMVMPAVAKMRPVNSPRCGPATRPTTAISATSVSVTPSTDGSRAAKALSPNTAIADAWHQ